MDGDDVRVGVSVLVGVEVLVAITFPLAPDVAFGEGVGSTSIAMNSDTKTSCSAEALW